MITRRFQDLIAWQKAHLVAKKIYETTETFPQKETFGLVNQTRRAAVSTAANIAEGSKRSSSKDFSHFLNMAQGSNEEVKYYLILSSDLNYVSAEKSHELYGLCDRASALIYSLRTSLR